MGKLDGKIAIITGASKGIGAGIARVFTEEGACVVLATLKTYGTIDILDCNAGICTLGDFLTSDDAWRDAHIDINIKGVWNVCRAALPTIVRNNAGSVVITSSVTGDMVADPGEVAYATTKAALVGFTKALAREMAPHNIRVNCICPGYVQTPLVEGMACQSDPDDPTRAISAIAHAVPLGHPGTPDECGELRLPRLKRGKLYNRNSDGN